MKKETRKINKESDVIRFPFESLNERKKEMKEESRLKWSRRTTYGDV